MSKNCVICVVNPRDGFDLLCHECRVEKRMREELIVPDPEPEEHEVDTRGRRIGGYVWCDMCGYNATLTKGQIYLLGAGHDTWCKDCAGHKMDSMLHWGLDLPDHISPDEPMPAHTQTENSRIV